MLDGVTGVHDAILNQFDIRIDQDQYIDDVIKVTIQAKVPALTVTCDLFFQLQVTCNSYNL